MCISRASYIADDPLGAQPLEQVQLSGMSLDFLAMDDFATGYPLISTVMARQLEALLIYREGNPDAAIELLRSAAADENGRPLAYGPPHVPKPSSELLGEMLLNQGRPQLAIAEFEKSLLRNTNRSLSLLGLARAQEAAGHAAAAETWALLASNWKGDLPELKATSIAWLGD